jgi:O-methyltransferase
MAGQVNVTPVLLRYVREVSLREDEILRELRVATAELPAGSAMQVMPEQGQLLILLVGLTGATAVLEIGAFTGYSTLCLARAVPTDGRVVTCEINKKWTNIAHEYWQRAGVADRIDLHIGDAGQTLERLAENPGPNSFDFVFIDADKVNYRTYFEASLTLLRPGGLIVLDNTLLDGMVINEGMLDDNTEAIREINLLLHKDRRVDISMLPVYDGITLARKKHHGVA